MYKINYEIIHKILREELFGGMLCAAPPPPEMALCGFALRPDIDIWLHLFPGYPGSYNNRLIMFCFTRHTQRGGADQAKAGRLP